MCFFFELRELCINAEERKLEEGGGIAQVQAWQEN